jgi:hypothetical protein
MAQKVEVLSGRFGHRVGTTNQFAAYPIVLRRPEKSQSISVSCPDCKTGVEFKFLSRNGLRAWRIACGACARLWINHSFAVVRLAAACRTTVFKSNRSDPC